MRWSIALLFCVVSGHAADKAPKLKNVSFAVKGIGQVEIKHEDVGEPIVEPERVQVFMTCAKDKRKILVRKFRMCRFEEYTYEEGVKTLTLRLVSGRVDAKSGKVVCDQYDDRNFDLAKVCK